MVRTEKRLITCLHEIALFSAQFHNM